jgi:DNA repair protein RAD57
MRRKIRGSDAVEPATLIRHVASKLAPGVTRLSAVLAPHVIRTGDAAVDSLLGGGVRSGSITELAGESAAGKSHLTLMLALAAQHPVLSSAPGGAVVIGSERVLETNRLVELAKVMRARHGGPPVKTLLDNIQTSRVADIEALEHALAFVVPHMLERAREGTAGARPIRLLVIDSLTALLCGDTERSTAGMAQRSRHICTVADRLKALAAEFGIAVVVVNQVKDVFGPEPLLATQAPASQAMVTHMPSSQVSADAVLPPMLYATQAAHFSGQSAGVNKEAALGIVWANAVNTRIMLARTGRRRVLTPDDVVRGPARKRARISASPGPSQDDDPDAAAAAMHLELDSKPTLIRRMCLVFSHAAAPAVLDYIITPSGVHALAGSCRPVDLGPALRKREMRARAAFTEVREEPHDVARVSLPPSSQPQSSQVEREDDDVYDDLGELPPEFWEGIEVFDQDPVAVGVVD